MKTKQLVVRSAVTIVATGLTLLSSSTSQASDRGHSGMRMGGSHGGIQNGAIHQGISNREMNRGRGADDAIGRSRIENRGTTRAVQVNGRDDNGGRGERERERRHGNDDGNRHDVRDDRGGRGERERRHGKDEKAASTTAREREPGDDHGRGHCEPGDDKGRGHGKDDKASSTTAREREPGDDHGRKHREPGDDNAVRP